MTLADPAAVPDGLTWCADDRPGLTRRRSGKGFVYRDRHGAMVRDSRTLDRIRALAIPPAWTEVWICPQASGHIQATGRDARGRKQYRYHPGWSASRSEAKFERMPDFARALPKLRRRVEADLGRPGVSRDKVLATTVRLLEITLIRIGNREYARANRSYGLTTLHKRHLAVDGTALRFQFRGKSGLEHSVSVRDRRLARVIRSLQDLPGQQVFKYRDAAGALVPVTSDDVNAYIRETLGDGFSAKDFRTWAGTVAAARALTLPECADLTASKRNVNTCVKAVAGLLGNTAAVARSAYIHPAILEAYAAGELDLKPGKEDRAFELAVLRFLEAARDAAKAD